VIYFPTTGGMAGGTWVYDLTMKRWHERLYYDGSALQPHLGRCYARAFDRHLVGDRNSGKIYELANNEYDDDGAEIRRIRTAPHITDEAQRTFYHSLTLDMDTGAGLSGQPAPEVHLRWSNDGGYNWTAERSVSAGAFNDTRKRVIWRRLGSGRKRTFEVRISDPMRVALVDAYLNATGGTA
jgi:hypothetical protein